MRVVHGPAGPAVLGPGGSRDPVERFAFAFTARSVLLRPSGVRPDTCEVLVGAGMLDIRFGRWRLCTSLRNVSAVEVGGRRRRPRAMLGVRRSPVELGVVFGSGPAVGACVRLHDPAAAIGPRGAGAFWAVTVTVESPRDLARALARARHDQPRTARP